MLLARERGQRAERAQDGVPVLAVEGQRIYRQVRGVLAGVEKEDRIVIGPECGFGRMPRDCSRAPRGAAR
jgi:hypothetical protein